MYDGSYETFEKIKRPDSVEIIAVTKDKKIIINKEEQPSTGRFYSLPAGIINKGEKPIEAAKRELLEETGMKAKKWKLIKKYKPFMKMEWTSHLYLATGCEKTEKQKTDPGEKIKVMKKNLNEFLKIILKEDFRNKEATLTIIRIMNKKGKKGLKELILGEKKEKKKKISKE